MSTADSVRPTVRWMVKNDLSAVLRIEQESFEFDWSEEEFVRCLHQRNCIGVVAEQLDQVVGFMIYELHRTRLHITNFAVDTSWRRRGVGRIMASRLIGKLTPQRRTRIQLEVRETNLAAQCFFRALGFKAVSVLRDFYEDTPEDAYLMQYRYKAAPCGTPAVLNRIAPRLAG